MKRYGAGAAIRSTRLADGAVSKVLHLQDRSRRLDGNSATAGYAYFQTQQRREELYKLVWTAPVTEVASRLGVSDVGLAKLCRRASIPVSGRGCWSRVRPANPTDTDPELVPPSGQIPSPNFRTATLPEVRANMLAEAIAALPAESPSVLTETVSVPGLSGAPDVRVLAYRPAHVEGALPALLAQSVGAIRASYGNCTEISNNTSSRAGQPVRFLAREVRCRTCAKMMQRCNPALTTSYTIAPGRDRGGRQNARFQGFDAPQRQ